MNVGIIVAIVIVVLIVIAVIAWLAMRKRRSDELKGQFGPEYDRAVQETGDQRKAESLLAERRKRVERLDTRPLTDEEHQRFSDAWRDVQAKFVDDPSGAIADADRLIADVMSTRGYPTDLYEQRTDVVSVEHPEVMDNFRTAHDISERNDQGDATTEDLRNAMLNYRSIFETLVSETEPATEEVRS